MMKAMPIQNVAALFASAATTNGMRLTARSTPNERAA
jgi:hypothetical protein